MKETLADRVRKRMDLLGLKQHQLARRCNVEQPSISRILSGKTKRPPYIYLLSKALETSVKWLETGIEDSTPAHMPPLTPPSKSVEMDEYDAAVAAVKAFRDLTPEARDIASPMLERELALHALKKRGVPEGGVHIGSSPLQQNEAAERNKS